MQLHSITMYKQNKIKRSDLVDQLREYQIRSKLDWASLSFFSYNTKLSSSSSTRVLSACQGPVSFSVMVLMVRENKEQEASTLVIN
ncbi:hypothetical protein HanHA300_Chr14g0508221 [Helianthus annuus]|nr:hypothetical protein HanHA300_Chr14g0508221 [Helianthus annuus]